MPQFNTFATFLQEVAFTQAAGALLLACGSTASARGSTASTRGNSRCDF